jgi:hypothetical protein
MNDPLNGGQADTRAVEFGCRVQALKGSEQLVGISRVETGAVVAHKITLGSVIPSNAEFDPCVWTFGAEFPSVAE